MSQSHCVCVDTEGIVWTWGANQRGELGLGDIAPRTVPYPNPNLKEKLICKVIAADGYTVAISKTLRQTEEPSMFSSVVQKTSDSLLPSLPQEYKQYQQELDLEAVRDDKSSLRRLSDENKILYQELA